MDDNTAHDQFLVLKPYLDIDYLLWSESTHYIKLQIWPGGLCQISEQFPGMEKTRRYVSHTPCAPRSSGSAEKPTSAMRGGLFRGMDRMFD
jgi:hypothetical protein